MHRRLVGLLLPELPIYFRFTPRSRFRSGDAISSSDLCRILLCFDFGSSSFSEVRSVSIASESSFTPLRRRCSFEDGERLRLRILLGVLECDRTESVGLVVDDESSPSDLIFIESRSLRSRCDLEDLPDFEDFEDFEDLEALELVVSSSSSSSSSRPSSGSNSTSSKQCGCRGYAVRNAWGCNDEGETV